MFIVDTAASGSVIAERVVKELGLKTDAPATVTVGGTPVPDIMFASIPLAGLEAGFGIRIDGILGFELFDRYVVDVDFDSRVLRFHPPAADQPAAEGQQIPLAIEENVPFVRVTLTNGKGAAAEGDFEFDTGQTGTLTLSHAFATSHQLAGAGQKSFEMTTGALLPGSVNARVLRVPAVRVGPHEALNVVALVTEQTGIAPGKAGILGNEFLRRFNLTIDYKQHRVTMRPNAHAQAPYEFDMSGMSLMAEGDALRDYSVRTVINGTPAAAAGIRAGDRLVSLDGKPAAQLSLAGIREALRRPDVKYSLVLSRGKQEVRTVLHTRRFI
jgi:hypothetical protein